MVLLKKAIGALLENECLEVTLSVQKKVIRSVSKQLIRLSKVLVLIGALPNLRDGELKTSLGKAKKSRVKAKNRLTLTLKT